MKERKAISWERFRFFAQSEEICEKVTFKPSEAARILESHNANNVRITGNNATAVLVEKALRSNSWQVTGETIIFDEEFNLLNGQGRLGGCVRSGRPLTSWTVAAKVANCTETDRVNLRRLRDHLRHRGHKRCEELQKLLLACSHFRAYGSLDPSGGFAKNIPYYETLGMIPQLKNLDVFTQWMSNIRTATNSSAAQKIGIICYVGSNGQVDDYSRYWFEKMKTGAGMPENDPVLIFREHLRKLARPGFENKISNRQSWAIGIMCWNSHIAGNGLDGLPRWRGVGPKAEPFPAIRSRDKSEPTTLDPTVSVSVAPACSA